MRVVIVVTLVLFGLIASCIITAACISIGTSSHHAQGNRFEFLEFFVAEGIVGRQCSKQRVIQQDFKDGRTDIAQVKDTINIGLPGQAEELLLKDGGRKGK